MLSSNTHLQEFLHTVCNEIRFKSVHKSIIKELSDHIEDQKLEYMKQGMNEELAFNKAIEQMGDPILVGRQLNNAHRLRTEWSILLIAAGLVILGGLIQYYMSGTSESTLQYFPRFFLYAPIGLAAFASVYFFDYSLLGRYPKLAYFILMSFTTAGFFLFNQINGTYRHVYYFALLFIPVFAGIVYNFRNKGYLGIVFSGIFYAGAALICFAAPSLTALFIITLSSSIILIVSVVKGYFGGSRKIALALVYAPTLLITLLTLSTLHDYQYQRLAAMLDPYQDPKGFGYFALTIKGLIASAKPFGTGNINFEQLLPAWSTDFSLTYIIAKLGYVPGVLIIVLLLALIIRMFVSVSKQKSSYGFLVSLSACIAITTQVVLYLLTNLGLIMPLSLTLPFISYGALGFVVNMILMGLLLSVYRRTDLVPNKLQSDV